MASLERLLTGYEKYATLPWGQHVAAAQRVWFAVYDPLDERRLRARIGAFENATRQAGHEWLHFDVTDTFSVWMAAHEYKNSYFEEPDYLSDSLAGYEQSLIAQVRKILETPKADGNAVVAISGIASLFGLMRVSTLIEGVIPALTGRLLVFFPGEVEEGRYRLLDARDGWNYLAVPITGGD